MHEPSSGAIIEKVNTKDVIGLSSHKD